jgi:hypothetical protein
MLKDETVKIKILFKKQKKKLETTAKLIIQVMRFR